MENYVLVDGKDFRKFEDWLSTMEKSSSPEFRNFIASKLEEKLSNIKLQRENLSDTCKENITVLATLINMAAGSTSRFERKILIGKLISFAIVYVFVIDTSKIDLFTGERRAY